MTATNPPFRADHVGSFLRPEALLEARRDAGLELQSTSEAPSDGAITAERLREIEDGAIREVVAFQEDVGLQSITDGEYRRGSWAYDLAAKIDGVVLKRPKKRKKAVKVKKVRGVKTVIMEIMVDNLIKWVIPQ